MGSFTQSFKLLLKTQVFHCFEGTFYGCRGAPRELRLAFSATECNAGLRASSTLNRRAMQPALAGRHKQRTLPPVYATLGWSSTEGFFHRPIPAPRQRNPQPGRASCERRPWPEVALTAWAGKRDLGSRQASRDRDSGRGQQVARGSSKWKRFLSSLFQRLRPAAQYRAQDRNLIVGERPGVGTRSASLRSPRLYFFGPSPAGRCDLRREGFLGPLGRAVWVRS